MAKLKETVDYIKWPTTLFNEDKIKVLIYNQDLGLRAFAIYNYLTMYACREVEEFKVNEDHLTIFAYDLRLDYNDFTIIFKKLLEKGLFNKERYEKDKILTNFIIEDTKESISTKRTRDRERQKEYREQKKDMSHATSEQGQANNDKQTMTSEQGQANNDKHTMTQNNDKHTGKVSKGKISKDKEEQTLNSSPLKSSANANAIVSSKSDSELHESLNKMNLHHFLESLIQKDLIPEEDKDITTFNLINDKLFKLNEKYTGAKVLRASYKVLSTMRDRKEDKDNEIYEPIKNLPRYLEKSIIDKMEEE